MYVVFDRLRHNLQCVERDIKQHNNYLTRNTLYVFEFDSSRSADMCVQISDWSIRSDIWSAFHSSDCNLVSEDCVLISERRLSFRILRLVSECIFAVECDLYFTTALSADVCRRIHSLREIKLVTCGSVTCAMSLKGAASHLRLCRAVLLNY